MKCEHDGTAQQSTKDFGAFGVSGEPQSLNHEGRAGLEDGAPSPAIGKTPKATLAEMGGMGKATRTGSLRANNGESIEIPGEGGPAEAKSLKD